MSPPRRRRRRRGAGRGGQKRSRATAQPDRKLERRDQQPQASSGGERRTRRRRRRGRSRRAGPRSPLRSEDLVRAPERERPDTLTAEHDGTTLEQIIGELQSRWGVPESPQEFRITIKVGEDRNGSGRTDRSDKNGAANEDEPVAEDRPKREKAPPPRLASREQSGPSRTGRRRRRRRRRGRGGSS
jgi:hypothetical protein